MEKISKKLISFMCENKFVEDEKREVYEYGINIFLTGILHFVSIVVIGLIMGMTKECLVMFISFFFVRSYAGGFHCSTPTRCYIFSVVANFLMLLAIKALSDWSCDVAFYCILSVSELAIIVIPVIESPEKPLSSKEKKIYKVISVTLSIIITVLAVLIYEFVAVNYGVSLCIGLTMVALVLCLALIVPKVQNVVKKIPIKFSK